MSKFQDFQDNKSKIISFLKQTSRRRFQATVEAAGFQPQTSCNWARRRPKRTQVCVWQAASPATAGSGIFASPCRTSLRRPISAIACACACSLSTSSCVGIRVRVDQTQQSGCLILHILRLIGLVVHPSLRCRRAHCTPEARADRL